MVAIFVVNHIPGHRHSAIMQPKINNMLVSIFISVSLSWELLWADNQDVIAIFHGPSLPQS